MQGPAPAELVLRDFRVAESGEVLLDLGSARAALSLAEDGSLRLRACAGAELPEAPDAALGRPPWQPAAARVEAGVEGLEIASEGAQGALRVELGGSPLRLRIGDAGGRELARLEALGFGAGGGGGIALSTAPGERFFGFGETSGSLDKRGARLRLRNRDPELASSGPRYVSIPFFLGLQREAGGAVARGLLLDALGPCHFDVAAARADQVQLTTDFDGIDVTWLPGPTPADVLRRLTARVGRPALPPLWALGHHQSRWSYASDAEVRALASEIRRRGIPTDAIHLDIDHMDGYRVFTFHPRRFPDPKGLCADLARQGFRVVAIVDPGVKVDEGFRVYREGRERGFFCRRDDGEPFSLLVWPKDAALPDFNRAEVRAWWGEQHRPLLDAGVAGIWNDMNEPAGWAAELRLGRLILPLRRQDLSRVVQSDPARPEQPLAHERVRNVYGHQECRATRAFLERERPARPFVLTRSGCAGIQRFAAVWTGDNQSRWSHLRESIPMLLNLSLSGVAFCGADIGGFALPCTPELYARWIQLGALYPFARTHSMWLKPPQEPWRFGRRVERIAREALELRMRLLPYLYGLFRAAEETGAPPWRPLFFEFPEDAESAAVEDQFMLGPALLAAPVLERGARERELYLPAGRWLGWHDDAQYVGPRRLRVAAPLERMPLFLRAGAILTTQSPVRHTGETPEEPCILELVPGEDGSAALVEDDGETTAYRDGALAHTALRLMDRAGGRLRLEIGRRHGGFAIAERRVRVVVRACPPPRRVYLDGHRLAEGEVVPGWLLRDGRLHVCFADRGAGHSLEVEPAP
jgi:alpha-glucosidase